MARRVVVVGVVAGALGSVVGIAGRRRPRRRRACPASRGIGRSWSRRSPRCRARPVSRRSMAVVSGVEGVVTARRTAGGRGVWIQDPTPDTDLEDLRRRVRLPQRRPGDADRRSGAGQRHGERVPRRRGSRQSDRHPDLVLERQRDHPLERNPLPAATVLGLGGRIPPTENIDDDGAGSVETGGTFDPANDAIDFYESLEGLILQVNDGAVVGATRSFGEITLLPDAGTWATGQRTPRGGILLGGYVDPNPERIIVDDEILRDIAPAPRPAKAMPDMNVGDSLTSPVVGPLDYSFSNYKIQATVTPSFSSAGLIRETTSGATDHQVAWRRQRREPRRDRPAVQVRPPRPADREQPPVARHPRHRGGPGQRRHHGRRRQCGRGRHRGLDAPGQAIRPTVGPTYAHRQIDPVDDAEGGAPGGKIRVGLPVPNRSRMSSSSTGPVEIPGPRRRSSTHPSGPRLS